LLGLIPIRQGSPLETEIRCLLSFEKQPSSNVISKGCFTFDLGLGNHRCYPWIYSSPRELNYFSASFSLVFEDSGKVPDVQISIDQLYVQPQHILPIEIC
jgi:hypothetical protein